jgi:hypothetical protein
MTEQRMIVGIEMLRNGRWGTYTPTQSGFLIYDVELAEWELKEGAKSVFWGHEYPQCLGKDSKGRLQITLDNGTDEALRKTHPNLIDASKMRLTFNKEAQELYEQNCDNYEGTFYTVTPTASAVIENEETGNSNTGLIIGLLAVLGIAYMATKKKGGK